MQDPFASSGVEVVGRALRERSRDELLAFSRQLGLTGVTKLAKDVLAVKIAAALEATRASATAGAATNGADHGPETTDSPTGSLAAKFNLGPGVDGKIEDDDPLPASIPWGYGLDRVTAMAVDPQRLYVYWEVTDGAIEAARKQLGSGGAAAWLSLRVYDITGRLFDGTNAHSYFDEGVGRDVRQWFFEIGKPTSTACVEIGLKSQEGFFVRIGRSGRVDFPRDAPQPTGLIEWLAVRTATGHAGEPMVGGAPRPDGQSGSLGGSGGGSGDGWQGWTDDAGFPAPGGGALTVESSADWSEASDESFQGEVGRTEWIGPVHRSEWQSGPFEYPVDAPLGQTLERHESGEISMRSEDGLVHVVYGPWQVVIRGAGARAERRVLATWEYRRTIEMAGGVERFTTEGGAVDGAVSQLGQWVSVGPGSSEWRYVYAGASDRRWVGASERRWMGASELVVRGGSEVWLMGASERMFRGASERLYKGSSERLYKGASERLYKGASERRLGGASERQVGGRQQLGAGEGVSGGGGPVPSGGPSPYPRPES